MDRSKAIRMLALGSKAMTVYDGASSAWEGMKGAKTASQLMVGGIRTLTTELRSPMELAIAAMFTALAGTMLFRK